MRATRAKGSLRKFLIRTAAPALLLGAAACAGDDVAYRPTPQILPQHISRIAIRPVIPGCRSSSSATPPGRS
ncbi:MAG: hypothetical protein AAB339_05600, partial [Elusimicrobiota bacterium]